MGYLSGFQGLTKLDKELPEVAAIQKKISQYIEEAEDLKERLEGPAEAASPPAQHPRDDEPDVQHHGHRRRRRHERSAPDQPPRRRHDRDTPEEPSRRWHDRDGSEEHYDDHRPQKLALVPRSEVRPRS